MSRTLKSDLACPPSSAVQVEDKPTDGQWRGKVNPVLVGGIQFLRFIFRLISELRLDQDLEAQTTRLFIESYKHASQFLPDVLPEHSQIEAGVDVCSAKTSFCNANGADIQVPPEPMIKVAVSYGQKTHSVWCPYRKLHLGAIWLQYTQNQQLCSEFERFACRN